MVSSEAVLKSGEDVQPVVLSLTDAKAHLNITHTYQDTLIQSYIDAAIDEAQDYTSRSLKIYVVTVKTSRFKNRLLLPMTPFNADLAIKYYDASNDLKILDPDAYVLGYYHSEPVIYFNNPSTLPALYSRVDAVVITYDAGYGLGTMPQQFVQFCKLMVGTFYEHRTDSVDKLPRLSYSLIHKFKLQWQ